MEYAKRKGTTGEMERNKQFLLEKKFTIWRLHSKGFCTLIRPHYLMFYHGNISKRSKMESIKGTYDNRQITATFTVSMAVKFLIIQITYEGETRIYSPSLSFLINSMSTSQMTSGQIRISLSSFPKNLYFHDLKKWKKASNILQSRCH